MSLLTIFSANRPDQSETFSDYAVIKQKLESCDVEFERWNAHVVLSADADQATILAAYQKSIDKLMQRYSFKAVDVVSVSAEHPDKDALRQKFLAEHTHDDFEVRFFIEGKGLFYLHIDDQIYAVLCEQGDLISVPNQTPHWFDMGETPHLKCIRFFTLAEGWVADFTGNPIADSFPKLEQFLAKYGHD